MPRVVVIGAGISGLSLGYYLKKYCSISPTILEKDGRVGGVIRSEVKEGYLLELGPKTLRKSEALTDELLLKKKEVLAKKRYLLDKGKLRKIPSFYFFSSLIMGLIGNYREVKKESFDESIASYCRRRFGGRFTEQLIDPLVKGIYAGDIEKLSIHSLDPSSFFKKRKEAPFTFEGGMQALPNALAEQLKGSIHLQCEVKKIRFCGSTIQISLADGQMITCDYLFSTVDAKRLFSFGVDIAELQEIPFEEVEVFHFCFNRPLLWKGFGYLVASKEREKIIGCVFDSELFQSPCGSISVIAKEGTTVNEAEKAARRHLSIDRDPVFTFHSHARLPQYTIGHRERLSRIESLQGKLSDRFFILGSSFYGISINDCIARSKHVAKMFSRVYTSSV